MLPKKDSAGKPVWYVRLYHEGKERRFGWFKTKTFAREFYEKAKQEQKLGRFFPERYQQGGFAKLEEVLNDYLETFTGRSKRDEERFKKKWLELFPGARLNALTASALEKARTRLAEDGRTPQTVNRYMGFLRRVLNKAIRDTKLFANPMSEIKMFRESTGRTRYLSPQEEKMLCDALTPEHARWVRLAILTGMRQMEQFSLRWEYVDLERGLITLPKTKAGRVQYVRLNQEARGILSQLADEAAKRQAVAEAEAIVNQGQRPIIGSPWVFPSENQATHVDPRNFYRRVYLRQSKHEVWIGCPGTRSDIPSHPAWRWLGRWRARLPSCCGTVGRLW
ncbi:MAG: tyrosine-type recombinase/integrase [Nitrospira sp.]